MTHALSPVVLGVFRIIRKHSTIFGFRELRCVSPELCGVRLPNVNDDFTGKEPDLGAHEFGQPLPHYGPRDGDIEPRRSK